MNILKELLVLTWNILLLVPKVLLAVFPMYNALSSLKQDLIAAAFGISPIVIYLMILLFSYIKKNLHGLR